MKRDNFNCSKKHLPGLTRVIENGVRVWMFDGKTFATKREAINYRFPPQHKLLPESKAGTVKPEETEEHERAESSL